ncbi:LuxQ periplasmic sensor domain-containing protein, partial [Vibrio astriarenae]
VLDNNFALMEKLKSESNVDNVLLIANDAMLAHSLSGDEHYDVAEVVARRGSQNKLGQLLITETPIKVNAATTELRLVSVQDNQG